MSDCFGIKSITFDHTKLTNLYLGHNVMDPVDFDFAAHPMSGFKGESYKKVTLNNEHANHIRKIRSRKGIPMVGLNVTECLPHGLYQANVNIFRDFAKRHSRNIACGKIIYDPFVE